MFHHHILHRDVKELLHKVYIAQSLKPIRHDWWKALKCDQKHYNINLSDDQISAMSKGAFKQYIEERIYKKASEEILQSRKAKIRKIIESVKCDKKGKILSHNYLKTNKLTPSQKQTLFKLRVFNFQTKSNYKSQYEEDMSCRVCHQTDSYEDEEHTFFACKVLLEDIEVKKDIKFKDIFGNIESQVKSIKYFTKIIQRRNIILELQR